jgi:DNA-binding XRE family transcriptional regulator
MTDPSHPSKKRRAGAEDVEIGRKIRALRLERGLSQSDLAKGIGLTFQQVQKYERAPIASRPDDCSGLPTSSRSR